MENYGFYCNGTYKAHLFTSVYVRVEKVGVKIHIPVFKGKSEPVMVLYGNLTMNNSKLTGKAYYL